MPTIRKKTKSKYIVNVVIEKFKPKSVIGCSNVSSNCSKGDLNMV